jgi:hypothetical protein
MIATINHSEVCLKNIVRVCVCCGVSSSNWKVVLRLLIVMAYHGSEFICSCAFLEDGRVSGFFQQWKPDTASNSISLFIFIFIFLVHISLLFIFW